MAIKISTTYSGRTDNTDLNYPYGKGRNVVGGVEGTGTPFEADWYNNLEGFLQGLLLEAGVTPDGEVDNANSSQLVEAVKGLEKSADKVITSDGRNVQERLDDLPSEVDAAGTAANLISQHNSDAAAHPELSAFITSEADRAETAADAATLNGKIFDTVALGETGTVDGDYFSVVSPTAENYLDLYKKVGNSAVFQKSYPSTEKVSELDKAVSISYDYEIIEGAVINTNPSGGVLIEGPSRAYLDWIDVESATTIYVSGATNAIEWYWVFRDAAMGWVSKSDSFGDGAYAVPSGAKFASRNVKTSTVEEDLNTLKIELSSTDGISKKFTIVDEELEVVKSGINEVDRYSLDFDYTVKYGGILSTSPSNAGDVIARSDGAYIDWIDLTDVTEIVVSGAIDTVEWYWIFMDENMDWVSNSESYGNGVFTVPVGAKFAGRTAQLSGLGYFEDFDLLKIKLTKYTAIGDRLSATQDDVELLKYDVDSVFASLISAGIIISKKDTITPNDFEGSTQTERIDNAVAFIKKIGGGVLELSVDTISNPETSVWKRDSALLLPDNCYVWLNDSTLKLSDGVFDNIIRNEGVTVNPDPYSRASATNRNVGIKIFGNGVGRSGIEGPDIPYTAPHPVNGGSAVPWVGDAYGWRAVGVLLVNVEDYEIAGFTMSKTTSWAISQEAGCENFKVHDLHFETSVKNGDGIDCRQGVSNGEIYNITGDTSDDLIALTALKWASTVDYPYNRYTYPLEVNQGVGPYDISSIKIWNIKGTGVANGVRVLSGGGSKIHDITINDVSDNEDGGFRLDMVVVETGYGPLSQMGDMYNIFANRVISKNSGTALKLSAPIQDSHFNYVRQERQSGLLLDDANATLQDVDVTNVL